MVLSRTFRLSRRPNIIFGDQILHRSHEWKMLLARQAKRSLFTLTVSHSQPLTRRHIVRLSGYVCLFLADCGNCQWRREENFSLASQQQTNVTHTHTHTGRLLCSRFRKGENCKLHVASLATVGWPPFGFGFGSFLFWPLHTLHTLHRPA